MSVGRVLHVGAAMAMVLAGSGLAGVAFTACVPEEYGVGKPCQDQSDCFTRRCVSRLCAPNNPAGEPYPTVDAAPSIPDAHADDASAEEQDGG